MAECERDGCPEQKKDHPQARYCSNSCARAVNKKKARAKKKADTAPKEVRTKECPCGRVFAPSNYSRAKYCSQVCQWQHAPLGKGRDTSKPDRPLLANPIPQYLNRTPSDWDKRNARMKANYHITAHQWMRMYLNQDGRCALCGDELPTKYGRGTATDHDHGCCSQGGKSCGECIRGIIHQQCNIFLGCIENNESLTQLVDDKVMAYINSRADLDI